MTVHTPIRPDDVRRAYAKWAGHYDFTFALFGRKYVKQVVEKINADLGQTKTHKHVLDVGAAPANRCPISRRILTSSALTCRLICWPARANAWFARSCTISAACLKWMRRI